LLCSGRIPLQIVAAPVKMGTRAHESRDEVTHIVFFRWKSLIRPHSLWVWVASACWELEIPFARFDHCKLGEPSD